MQHDLIKLGFSDTEQYTETELPWLKAMYNSSALYEMSIADKLKGLPLYDYTKVQLANKGKTSNSFQIIPDPDGIHEIPFTSHKQALG